MITQCFLCNFKENLKHFRKVSNVHGTFSQVLMLTDCSEMGRGLYCGIFSCYLTVFWNIRWFSVRPTYAASRKTCSILFFNLHTTHSSLMRYMYLALRKNKTNLCHQRVNQTDGFLQQYSTTVINNECNEVIDVRRERERERESEGHRVHPHRMESVLGSD